MRSPSQQCYLPSLLLVAATLFLTPGTLHAQTVPSQCLSAPDATCFDVLNTRLAAIEATMTDPDERTRVRQMWRAQILAASGRLDAAEALAATLDPTIKDDALILIMQELGPETQHRGRRLLSMIAQNTYEYELARAYYLENLAKTTDFDQLMAEFTATKGNGGKLDSFKVLIVMLQKATEAGQTDAAIRLIETETTDNATDFQTLAFELAMAGKFDYSERVIAKIQDQDLRFRNLTNIAEIAGKAGNTAKAVDLLVKALDETVTFDDYDEREWAFTGFTQAALSAGRIDLAVGAIPDMIGTSPRDVAYARIIIMETAVAKAPETEWQPLLEDTIKLLEESLRGGALLTEDQDKADTNWSALAMLVAQSGDPDRAKTLIARIPNKKRQNEELSSIAFHLTADRLFSAALAIISDMTDSDIQVQRLIGLAMRAHDEGQTEIRDAAYNRALGLIEGPEHINVSESTFATLAHYEANIGAYERADTRLTYVADLILKIYGHIANVESAANFGTAEELDQYIAKVQEAIALIPSPDERKSWTEALFGMLGQIGKYDAALAAIDKVSSNPQERDALLEYLFESPTNDAHLVQALAATEAIASGPIRQQAEHKVLLRALQLTLTN